MDGWDITFLIVAGYVAVISLVRLMRARRDAVVDDVRAQFRQEQARLKKEEWKSRHKKRRPAGAA